VQALRKGLETIKTLRSLLDKYHSRTSYGALIELARLSREREQLCYEVRLHEKRSEQINTRLREIEEAEKWLHEVATDNEMQFAGIKAEKKPLDVRRDLEGTVMKY
jgi:predicted nuclease with TOPRIM domain